MTLDHDTGWYNVQGTLNAWLAAQLAANRPASTPNAALIFDHPEQPLVPPCWSVHHLGTNPDAAGIQGGHVGNGQVGRVRYGILEVSCWVTRRDAAWRKQLAQLQDALTVALADLQKTGSGLAIRDFYASEHQPAALAYRIMIDRAEGRMPPTDPNPDIERRRVLVYYHWTERT